MDVFTGQASRIRIRPGGLAAELQQLGGTSAPGTGSFAFAVCDATALGLHGKQLGDLGELPRFVVEPGEASKSFTNLEALLSAMADAGLDRRSHLLSFGGGVTSDLAGLAAALYMRGMAWSSVPTTLLAQVDASVGGKTAINLPQAKNLVGCFHQPTDVVIDTTLLGTLESDEWRSGLGEVLKAALLGATLDDGTLLFDWLEAQEPGDLAAPDTSQPPTPKQVQLWATLVHACVAHKAAVVAADFKETGVREQLNLGHTFAHAIEHVAGFGTIPHGVAVAAGLGLALARSQVDSILDDAALPERTAALAKRLNLPSGLEDVAAEFNVELDAAHLASAMKRDKKARSGDVRFVLPRSISGWTISR